MLLLQADNSTIIEGAISQIKTLQSTLQMLEKKKLERMMTPKVSYMNNDDINNNNNSNNNNNNVNYLVGAGTVSPVMMSTWASSNVVLNICGNDAQFTVYAVKKPGLLTNLCCVLEKHQLEVDSTHISSHVDQCVYMFHAYARVGNGKCDQLPKQMNVAEIYKHAAEEMIKWVSS
ncbi:transcription factor bHLH95-like [Silene latifolia]|uniref:transcription factor bHLH95-like n=1 Tax=Silene latifolia TaxID=37657 RepID=UPI003D7722B7